MKGIEIFELKLAQEWPSFSLWFVVSFAFGLLWFLHLECIEPKSFLAVLAFGVISAVISLRGAKYLGFFGLVLSAGLIFGHIWGRAFCKDDLLPPARAYEWINCNASIESIRPAKLGKRSDMVLATLEVQGFKACMPLMRHGRAAVYFSAEEINGFFPGDIIRVTAKAIKQRGRILPGGYDFSLQGALNKVDIYAYSTLAPTLVSSQASRGFKSVIMQIRQRYYKSIKEHLDGDRADFASALIIGESRGLSRSLLSDMRCAGISHVLCVSGLHLTLVAGLAFKLLRFALSCIPYIALSWNVKLVAAILAWMASAFYWMLSGMNVATTRAFLMTSVGMLATMLNKSAYSFRTLIFAMFTALLVNPIDILNISFQLSFSAVFALVGSRNFLAPYLAKLDSFWLRKISRALLTNLHSSAVISFVTAPIAIYHFYAFANYQVLGNLIILPLVGGLLMPLTLACIVLIPLDCYSKALKLMSLVVDVVMWAAGKIAAFPQPLAHLGYLCPESAVACVLGMCCLLLWRGKLSLIGFALILFGCALHLKRGKPNVIFDCQTCALGISRGRHLDIYAKKMSQFSKEYWCSWFGQSQAFYTKLDLSQCNLSFELDNGRKVAVVNVPSSKVPSQVDLIINNSNSNLKVNAPVISREELLKLGSVAIYFKDDEIQFLGTNLSKRIGKERCQTI